MRISVIVPVYNEAEIIRPFIAGLMKTAAGYDHEVIVVDGAPGGGTLKRVEEPEVIKIAALRGRGNQMNEGRRRQREKSFFSFTPIRPFLTTRFPPSRTHWRRRNSSGGRSN